MHPENAEWTCFEQSASLEVKSFFGFENAVEKLAVKHYAQSIEKGKEIIEYYVQVLRDEGVTAVDAWPDDGASGCTSTTNENPEDGDRCSDSGSEWRRSLQHESRESPQALECRRSSDDCPRRLQQEQQHQDHSRDQVPSAAADGTATATDATVDGDGRRRSSAAALLSLANSGQNHSVKSQVMSKAKNRICFIYNVINDNMQRNESV